MERFAAEEEKEIEEQVNAEASRDDNRGGRGGRGGRGRGYGGGRGGSSRGRGRGGFSGYQPRSEWEGEDDDDVYYSAPTNKPKKAAQKQSDLQMDEENYPAL